MKKKIWTAFKFLFSTGVILYILIYKVSLSKIIDILFSSNIWYLLAGFSLHALGFYISAARWNILIKSVMESKSPGIKKLIEFYLVAGFFNLFLPTRFGGDISRIIDTKDSAKSYTKSTSIVLIERLNGIGILFLFSFLASLYCLLFNRASYIQYVGFFLGLAGLVLVLMFFMPLSSFIIKKLKFLPEKIYSKIKIIDDSVGAIRKDKKSLLNITLFSFILQINVIIHYFFIGEALGIEINLLFYFIFIPILLVILVIPISINGIGLRDISLIQVFKEFSIPASFAVAFSTIDLFFMIILGLLGGLIFTFRKKK